MSGLMSVIFGHETLENELSLALSQMPPTHHFYSAYVSCSPLEIFGGHEDCQ